jgi:hypothetical protein
MIFLCVHILLFDSLVFTTLVKVDLIRTVTLPHLEPFGISSGLELKVSHFSEPVWFETLTLSERR